MCIKRVKACNGESLESVKRGLGKIAQALTHSTLHYVSPVAFEHTTPYRGKISYFGVSIFTGQFQEKDSLKNLPLKAGLAPALLSLVLFYPPPCSYPTLFPFTLLGLL